MRAVLLLGILAGCGDDSAVAPDGAGHDATMPDGNAPDGMTAGGCMPRTSGYLTDRMVHAEPALPALPAAGGTLTDPTFGTSILRATDANDCANCGTAYSYWPTFNVNSTVKGDRLRGRKFLSPQGNFRV